MRGDSCVVTAAFIPNDSLTSTHCGPQQELFCGSATLKRQWLVIVLSIDVFPAKVAGSAALSLSLCFQSEISMKVQVL